MSEVVTQPKKYVFRLLRGIHAQQIKNIDPKTGRVRINPETGREECTLRLWHADPSKFEGNIIETDDDLRRFNRGNSVKFELLNGGPSILRPGQPLHEATAPVQPKKAPPFSEDYLKSLSAEALRKVCEDERVELPKGGCGKDEMIKRLRAAQS